MVQWKMGPNKWKNEFSSLFPLLRMRLEKSILIAGMSYILALSNPEYLHIFQMLSKIYQHHDIHFGKDKHRSRNPAWVAMIHRSLPKKNQHSPWKMVLGRRFFPFGKMDFLGAMLNSGGVPVMSCWRDFALILNHRFLWFHFTSWNMFKSHCWPSQLSMELGNKHDEVNNYINKHISQNPLVLTEPSLFLFEGF